jgi:hypothetical protein
MVMNMANEYSKKKEIIKDIILKEEDVLSQLERLVKLAKPFLRIEENTGRIVLSPDFQLTNSEKIFLFLLGKYFAYHSDITKEFTAGVRDIGEGLGIVVTTVSAPLGRLVRDHVVDRTQKDSYQVSPHNIEKTLKDISQRYVPAEKINNTKAGEALGFSNVFGQPLGIDFSDLFGKNPSKSESKDNLNETNNNNASKKQ